MGDWEVVTWCGAWLVDVLIREGGAAELDY